MEHSVHTQEVDCFAILPDDLVLEILYFLPTKLAAQTSVLSRRFHKLWESSASLDLDFHTFRDTDLVMFHLLANRTLINRNPPSPIRRLCLRHDRVRLNRVDIHALQSYILSLITKASTLGLRHLIVELDAVVLLPFLPFIFSLNCLEYLSVGTVFTYPPSLSITLTHLKSLQLEMVHVESSMLTQLLEAMIMLEDLNLQVHSSAEMNLRSVTVRRLKICSRCSTYLRISIPSLEILELEIKVPSYEQYLDLTIFKNCIRWEVPALKKVVIQLENISAMNVHDVYVMLRSILHVEKLHVDIQQSLDYMGPFDTLGGANPPTFVNLKHIDLNICCHKINIAALVLLLQRCPILESLNIVHKPALRTRRCKGGNLWRSKLPRNAQGNYRHAYFKDLHISENKKQLLNRLTRKKSDKRSKI